MVCGVASVAGARLAVAVLVMATAARMVPVFSRSLFQFVAGRVARRTLGDGLLHPHCVVLLHSTGRLIRHQRHSLALLSGHVYGHGGALCGGA